MLSPNFLEEPFAQALWRKMSLFPKSVKWIHYMSGKTECFHCDSESCHQQTSFSKSCVVLHRRPAHEALYRPADIRTLFGDVAFFFLLAFFDETEARNPQTTFCRHPLWFLNFTVHWPRQSLKKPKHDWGKLGPKPDWIFNNSPTLDDGWPESVEEQGLLLLVWRHHITKQYIKDVL